MNYIELKTAENTKVYLRPNAVEAIEEIPATARSEASLRIYVGGYKFVILEITLAALLEKLK